MPEFFKTFAFRSVLALALVALVPLQARSSSAPPTAPDSTLYTTYALSTGDTGTFVSWSVCGSTQQSEGCYAGGNLGPFVAVGAMLEGNPSVKANVVSRAIYVVDSGGSPVKLYVYEKTDTVTSSDDTVSVTLTHTVDLSLTGGSTALCSMAANDTFLFIGTNEGDQALSIRKSNLKVTEVGVYALGVGSITADQYGYITVTEIGLGSFSVFSPNGESVEDGGGADFMLGTTQAVPVNILLKTDSKRTHPIRGYRLKPSQEPNVN
jgi:hypothetical protein